MIKKISDNTSFQGPRYRIFTMYKGEALSRLFVLFADLEAAKLNPYDFSDFSLIDEEGMYLDGDEDAQTFIDTYPKHTGYKVLLNEVEEEIMPSTVKERNKPLIAQKYWNQRKKNNFRIVK